MKEVDTYDNEIENSMVDCLENIGYCQAISKTICFFVFNESGGARDIEYKMGLRQPEVSIGTHKLINENIIDCQSVKCNGKGRPRYEYHRKKEPKEILNFVIDRCNKDIKERKELIGQLQNFIVTMDKDKYSCH